VKLLSSGQGLPAWVLSNVGCLTFFPVSPDDLYYPGRCELAQFVEVV